MILKKVSLLTLLVFLSACGGGSSPATSSSLESSSEEESSETTSDISSSEDSSSYSSEISSESSEKPAELPYITLDNTYTVKDVDDTLLYGVTPSLGTVNVLVIPIEFSDYVIEDKEGALSYLDDVFNAEELDYFYSVSKYYELSSYGNLDFNFVIAPWTELTEVEATSITTSTMTRKICQGALGKYRDAHKDEMSMFDSDEDGCLDAVWFIYSAPMYTWSRKLSNEFWAYTTRTQNYGTHANPSLNSYSWASIYFALGPQRNWQDAHTFIHETGHLLGLDDYYSYSDFVSPLGGGDMMDHNILDHNAWSKYSLGWIQPKLMIDDGIVELGNFQETGDAIFISLEDECSEDPFGEYLVLEYYSPTHLNTLDSHYSYDGHKGPNKAGLKITHVDARLIKGKASTGQVFYEYTTFEPSKVYYYVFAHSNSKNRAYYENQYPLINLLDAAGRDFTHSYKTMDEDSLWNEFESVTFDEESIANQFVNKTVSNSGALLPLDIYVSEMNEHSITLDILL